MRAAGVEAEATAPGSGATPGIAGAGTGPGAALADEAATRTPAMRTLRRNSLALGVVLLVLIVSGPSVVVVCSVSCG